MRSSRQILWVLGFLLVAAPARADLIGLKAASRASYAAPHIDRVAGSGTHAWLILAVDSELGARGPADMFALIGGYLLRSERSPLAPMLAGGLFRDRDWVWNFAEDLRFNVVPLARTDLPRGVAHAAAVNFTRFPAAPGPIAVPEPSTLLLLGIGMTGVAARRLRRR